MSKSPLKAGKLALKTNILDSLRDAVILVDANREIIDYNRAAEEIVPAKTKGQDLSVAFADKELLSAVDRALKKGVPVVHEITFPFPVGRSYEVDITSLAREGEHKKGGVMLAMHDITVVRRNEQIRADFVANVSHELRSPLTSMMGFIETLQGPAKNDPVRRDAFLNIMAQEAGRMAFLLEDLLSLSLVEAHEHERPEGEVAIAEVVVQVVERLQIRAHKKKMSIAFTCGDEKLSVRGERSQLTQVIENLIDNAIKYGDEKSQIDVTMSRVAEVGDLDGPVVAVAVRNQGQGIQDEDISRLTERFYRVDKVRSRAIGGTGLGLAIVKHILNRHRGKLAVSSILGKESIFTAYVPQ